MDLDEADTRDPSSFVKRLLAVVWMAILLGIALQLLILAAKSAMGAPWPGVKWLPDLLNGVTWAVLVCFGVVLGTLAARARTTAMGLLGLISAPLGFSVAKGLQRGLQSVLDAPIDKITPALMAVCAVKSLEYACLGAAVGWLIGRPRARIGHFVSAGAMAGVLFGGVTVWITAAIVKAKPPGVVGVAINELLFPIGCALVIYLATRALRHIALLKPELPLADDPAAEAGVPLA
ncbi:hypothetical protein BH10PSE4_BH10PSE4_29300 [soil metagenome]